MQLQRKVSAENSSSNIEDANKINGTCTLLADLLIQTSTYNRFTRAFSFPHYCTLIRNKLREVIRNRLRIILITPDFPF